MLCHALQKYILACFQIFQLPEASSKQFGAVWVGYLNCFNLERSSDGTGGWDITCPNQARGACFTMAGTCL